MPNKNSLLKISIILIATAVAGMVLLLAYADEDIDTSFMSGGDVALTIYDDGRLEFEDASEAAEALMKAWDEGLETYVQQRIELALQEHQLTEGEVVKVLKALGYNVSTSNPDRPFGDEQLSQLRLLLDDADPPGPFSKGKGKGTADPFTKGKGNHYAKGQRSPHRPE